MSNNKHVNNFERFRNKRNNGLIKEDVYPAGNTYMVRFVAEVPKSLVNQYLKKEAEAGNDKVKSFFSETDVAEGIVKFALQNNLTVDRLPVGIMTGEVAPEESQLVQPVQGQPAQAQPVQGQVQVQVQTEPVQGQGQVQVQTEPVQGQAQGQPVQGQAQGQPVQGQAQGQPETDLEDLDDVLDETEDEDDETGEEELPI
jgi:hypothetical protein